MTSKGVGFSAKHIKTVVAAAERIFRVTKETKKPIKVATSSRKFIDMGGFLANISSQ